MSRTSSPATTGPVRLGAQTRAAVRPTAAPAVTGGFWYDRRGVNARVGIPQCPRMLESAGNLHNLRLDAGKAECGFRGDYPFQDTDVYKWLEAASWQLAQDAVAGRDSAALNAEVDRITVFGPAGSGRPIDRFDAHPEVETALAEMYRETGGGVADADVEDGWLRIHRSWALGDAIVLDSTWPRVWCPPTREWTRYAAASRSSAARSSTAWNRPTTPAAASTTS